MLKLYRVSGISGIDPSHETYLCVSTDVHEQIEDNSVYKEKEDWMDFDGIGTAVIDYTDQKVLSVSLEEPSKQESAEHIDQYEYRKNWILSKIDKWLLQQPEGVSLEQYLLSKQNLQREPYSLSPVTLSPAGDSKPSLQGTDYCPYCNEKYFMGVCVNPNCPAGQQLSLKVVTEEEQSDIIPTPIEIPEETEES